MQTHRDYQIEDQLFCRNRARNNGNDPIGPKIRRIRLASANPSKD